MTNRTHSNNIDGSLHISGQVGSAFVNNYLCHLCSNTVEDEISRANSVGCDGACQSWFHRECVGLSITQLNELNSDVTKKWYCELCRFNTNTENHVGAPGSRQPQDIPIVDKYPSYTKAIDANTPSSAATSMVWGEMKGFKQIEDTLNKAYDEITKWRKNFFKLPYGSASKAVVEELCNLMTLYNTKPEWEALAMKAIIVILPLILQKPSKNSKAKDHKQHLERRMQMWRGGLIKSLIREGKEIQKRIKSSKRTSNQNLTRSFTNLILQGKVSAACKLINRDEGGPLDVNDQVMEILKQKHPEAKPARAGAIVENQSPRFVEPIAFESIDGQMIFKAAMQTRGSGGPSQVDAEIWRQILCSKSFQPASSNLCEQIAIFARNMNRFFKDPHCLVEYSACRLIPLDKEPGSDELKIRPIGIGEVLRRIVGKALMRHLKPEIIESAGPTQTSSGVAGGTEAAIHAMREIFDDHETEAMIFVDADNAFNSLNREASLQNMPVICPEFSTYLINTYRQPARLYINGSNGSYILSEEGSTQGDNCAMGMYGCSTRPLIDYLGRESHYESAGVQKAKQVWYADDSSAAGKMESVFVWWKELCSNGPLLGYYPSPSKCWLVVKDQAAFEKASTMFHDSGINITLEGRPFLGSAIGSERFTEKYVKSMVEEWVKDVTELANIAVTEPHVAYYGYVTGLSKRWLYLLRTTSGISRLLTPLEDAIYNELLPCIVGRPISPIERSIFSLPTRMGGMGIANPVETSEFEYRASVTVTEQLKNIIINQLSNFDEFNHADVKSTKARVSSARKEHHEEKLHQILANPSTSEGMKRALELSSEKGSSIWLSTNPSKDHGFYFNKVEFRDALCLRYDWQVKGMATACACGKPNDINHSLSCKKGGYVIMRHNALRDAEASLLKEVCKDVKTEPELIPVEGEELHGSTTSQDRARLDISARGVYGQLERVFFDVRVTHPNTQTNCGKSLRQIYKEQEREKKARYNERIIEVEKATFVPLVFTTSGGMAPECQKLNKRLAELIAMRRNESYADVMTYIRKKLRFSLLKATLIALRGYRGSPNAQNNTALSEVAFNLV